MSSTSRSEPPRFSVVVVTYNSRENIGVCLDSLRRCSGGGDDLEIIVADNASRDGTPDFLAQEEKAGRIRALLNTENFGFSKGCNLGAAKARGEFLVFLNPDTLVAPGWAEAMAEYFRDPGVGAVGPLSNYVAGLQRLDLHLPAPYDKGARIPGDDAVGQSANVARILADANRGRGVRTKLLIGFCLMIRRRLFREMGGMDERLFLGNDDLDLSWRLRGRGLELVVATDAFVFHEGQKSFKTEKKSHVDRLVQESTDALYLKLVDHYGGRDKVPSSQELWGMSWFQPSPALLEGRPAAARTAASGNADASDPNSISEARMAAETHPSQSWRGVTVLVFLGPGIGSEADRLEATLSTLPARPADVILLNCTGWSGAVPGQPQGGFRRLDLGAACSPRSAVELSTALAADHILFCAAGVGFTALFNHWVEKQLGALPTAMLLPVRLEGAGPGTSPSACAFLCRKTWLREALGTLGSLAPAGTPSGEAAGSAAAASFLAAMADRLAAVPDSDRRADPPWLLARAADLPSSAALPGSPLLGSAPAAGSQLAAGPATGKWTEAIRNYPEILAGPMRGAEEIGFAGTIADTLPVDGTFHVFDLKGDRVPFQDQDLVILRLTPDLVKDLPERLRNLRHRGNRLKRLLVVLNSMQALRLPKSEANPLAPVDVTPQGARAALWQAGVAVASEKPYTGIPPVQGAVGDLDGWTLLEAVPRAAGHALRKKVSIVILGFNQVEYTKKCIESIRRHTRQDYELILVDNGSKDGTEAYFRSVPGAKVIRNAVNLGVSRGWNQGMRLAEGEYILIFNNDTIVGPDWLENMVRLCESDPSVGMVGPRSNYIAGPQIVKPVPYKDESGIQGFIAAWQREHDLRADEFDFIKGFCLLIPRAVFAKVGFFDERFGKGNFEDDDYCVRVRCHGWRTLIAHDSFIHHYGSVSFNQEDVDWKALMLENQRKFTEKWSRGAAAVHDTVVSDPGVSDSAGPSWTPAPAPAPVSPRPAHDASARLAEAQAAYGRGDIAAARLGFLDVQALHPENAEAYCGLGAIAFHDGAAEDAGKLFLRCLQLDPSHADAARNLIDVLTAMEGRFDPGDASALAATFPANPVFREALAEAGIPVPSAGPAPRKQPELPPWRSEVEARIAAREYAPVIDALERRLKAGQDLSACYNYLGVIAHACGDNAFAAEHFRTALRHGPAHPDTVHNLADTLLALGRAEEALRLLENPPELEPGTADAAEMSVTAEQLRNALEAGAPDPARLTASREANLEAEALLRAGEPGKARDLLEQALRGDAGDFRALNNLGLAEWYLGRAEAAWERFRACLALRPAFGDALVNAFDAALACGRADELGPIADKALARRPDHPEARRIAFHLDREGRALAHCRSFEALEEDAAILARADKAMQENRKSDAINAYLDAMQRRPQNPQALNGLGIIAFAESRHVDAYALFDAACALHPMDQDILVNLWQAAQALRREQDVLPRLRTSLERNPALHDVKAILANA